MAKKRHNDYRTGIPKHEMEAFARILLPESKNSLRARMVNGNLKNGKQNGARPF